VPFVVSREVLPVGGGHEGGVATTHR
jgi:hypothetical protein